MLNSYSFMLSSCFSKKKKKKKKKNYLEPEHK